MKKSILFAAIICMPGVAQAAEPETFTVVTEGGSITMVGVEGGPSGTYTTGKGTTTWADGSTTADTSTCVGMGQPPNDHIFAVHQVCNVETDAGTFSLIMGCNPDPGGAMGCVGNLFGKTGRYAGRGGGFTLYAKDGKGHGVGQWGAAPE